VIDVVIDDCSHELLVTGEHMSGHISEYMSEHISEHIHEHIHEHINPPNKELQSCRHRFKLISSSDRELEICREGTRKTLPTQ
jgi:hypothetical protein